MNELNYYDVPLLFPMLMRGVFSMQEDKVEEKNDGMQYRIVARGMTSFSLVRFCGQPYKFSSCTHPTLPPLSLFLCQWSSLKTHTKLPYTLMLKSNGCIIFIAVLSPSKLLVTLKHSAGPVQSIPESHAQAGEHWLHHHLKQVGKTMEELVEVLLEKDWTAVAEVSHPFSWTNSNIFFMTSQLCDDNFEEHVLPYSTEKMGLHLHSLNGCSKHFKTQPTAVVAEFMREWGFIVTVSHVLSSIPEVKDFVKEIGHSSKWNGEARHLRVLLST
jgi:tRNA ligase